jgi:hypothetical protein
MKLQISVVALALTISTSAYSLEFNPPGARVKMTGTFNMIIDGSYTPCNISAVVKTGVSGRNAKMVSFGVSNNCPIAPVGLPWNIKAATPNKARIKVFGYSEADGICGPATLEVNVSGSGLWAVAKTFKGPVHNCGISGSWTSTPPLTIIP